MKTVGIPQIKQLISIKESDGKEEIKKNFGLKSSEFEIIPYIQTPKPDDTDFGTYFPDDVWEESSVTQKWFFRNWTYLEKIQRTLEKGFYVAEENFYLEISDSSIQAFTQLATLASLQLSLGKIDESTIHKIKDKLGNIKEVTTSRLLDILSSYGLFYKNIWDVKA